MIDKCNISKEAQLVKDSLIAKGLESPITSLVENTKSSVLNVEQKRDLIAKHVKEILTVLDLDLTNENLQDTPQRVARMYVDEIFSGLNYENFPKITMSDNQMQLNEMVKVQDISLTSTCEHHLVVIDGLASVAYIPRAKIIGLSKINRIVKFFAMRPQLQERMTQQILVALQVLLGSQDVAVTISATHYCVKARGVIDTSSKTTTTSLGGIFKTNSATRAEFFHGLK